MNNDGRIIIDLEDLKTMAASSEGTSLVEEAAGGTVKCVEKKDGIVYCYNYPSPQPPQTIDPWF